MGREDAQRRLIIVTNEAAVAEDVGAEYGGELPLHLGLMRSAPSFQVATLQAAAGNFRIAAMTAPGDIVKWYGANTDIDDRKHTEAPLAPSFSLRGLLLRSAHRFFIANDRRLLPSGVRPPRFFAFNANGRVVATLGF